MKISFVVPTRDNARTLQACVGSLRAQTHPEVEVVVVDNDSTDDTRAIAARQADMVDQRGPERCAQRNHGTRLSTGEVVVFIDSDMVLDPGVPAPSAAFVAAPDLGLPCHPRALVRRGLPRRLRALEKSLYVGDAGVEAPRAFRREVIETVGGWDESLTAAEDWDLRDRPRAAGVHVGRVDAWIWHDEGRLRLRATFGKKRYYGRWVGEYFPARVPVVRTSPVRPCSPTRRLARHPLLTTGLVTLKSVEAAGLLAGIRDARSCRGRPARPRARYQVPA